MYEGTGVSVNTYPTFIKLQYQVQHKLDRSLSQAVSSSTIISKTIAKSRLQYDANIVIQRSHTVSYI